MKVIPAKIVPFDVGYQTKYAGKVNYMTKDGPGTDVPTVERVYAILDSIDFPLEQYHTPILIVSYQLRLWSQKHGWGQEIWGQTYDTHIILGKMRPGTMEGWITHEVGHVVQNHLPRDKYKEYKQLRTIENWNESGAYERRPREIFAEDFRMLFGSKEAKQQVYFPDIEPPDERVRTWFMNIGGDELNKPQYIIIHHSATLDSTTNDWEIIRKNHKAKGWRDIGYHYGIEMDNGQVVVRKGRAEHETGSHCKANSMNTKSIGICLLGNYEKQKPTEEQLQILESLCKDIMQRYQIPPENVLGHGEVKGAATACPGKFMDLEALRKRLAGGGTVKTDYEGHYFEKDIEAVKGLGLMTGKNDHTFEPDTPVTRAEMAAVINRLYLKLKKGE